MRINVTKGSSPLNLVKYLLDERKQREGREPEIDSNMFGSTAEQMAEEFRFSHNLNPRVKQTMAHYSLSLSPGERVDSETRHAITKRLLQLAGHEDCQYVSAEHFDQSHKNDVQHWHVGTSNVDLDGNHIEDDFMRVRLRSIEKQLEQEFSLVQVKDLPARDQRHIPTGEYRYKERTGITLPREKLWDKIQQHTTDSPSMTVLAARLKADGVGVQFRPRDNRITGISFEIDQFACSGGKLGRAYSFPGLQKHFGVTYDSEQDQALLQLQQMSVDQCQEWLRLRQEQEEERETQGPRDYYRDRYQHYSPRVNVEPKQHDVFVAIRALQVGHKPDEAVLIIANGTYAQAIKRDQGRDKALAYASERTEQAIKQLEQEQARAKSHER